VTDPKTRPIDVGGGKAEVGVGGCGLEVCGGELGDRSWGVEVGSG
jgi:hypothetical protein